MRRIFSCVILLFVSATALAQGRQLHDASCLQCHRSLTGGQPNNLYSRDARQVQSMEGLTKRVAYCAVAADAHWTEMQRQQVVEYLNREFYKF